MTSGKKDEIYYLYFTRAIIIGPIHPLFWDFAHFMQWSSSNHCTIVFHLSQGDVWKLADHPDEENYAEQRIYFVIVEGYIYLVPHVVEKDYIFLKTIIPSRKATRAYKSEQEG